MSNDNKCHCGKPAPWLVVVRVVKYAKPYGAHPGGTIIDVTPPMETSHWAACDKHLAEGVRGALTRAPDKMEYEHLITVRGPDEPTDAELQAAPGWVAGSGGQV